MTTSSVRPPARFPAASGGDGDDRLAEALRRIQQADDFPVFSQRIREVVASLDGDEHSARQLADMVRRDYGLTLKVVRTANSAHYNRGRPVTGVTQAMMLLGVGTVRSLALGMLLFEHYRARATTLRELLLLSLLSANHAREAALRLQADEPEAAHLAGLCRNIGEVLAACHLPAAYAEVRRCATELLLQQAARAEERRARQIHHGRHAPRAAGASLDVEAAATTAAFRVLGFSFEDLGDALLAHWGMPAELRRCVRAGGRPGETQLQTLAAFGHELTTAVYRGDQALSESGVPVGAATVLEKYGPLLRLQREALREVLAAAVDETRELFAEAGVQLDRLRVARQTAAALAELGAEEEDEEGEPPPRRADAPADDYH
jgi:HD-like signal output (HDOD) protein